MDDVGVHAVMGEGRPVLVGIKRGVMIRPQESFRYCWVNMRPHMKL